MHNYNTCTICKEVKTIDRFIKDKRVKRGYRNQCKDCETKRVALANGQTYGQKGSINRIHSKNLVSDEFVEKFDFFRQKMNDCNTRCKKNGKPYIDTDIMDYWQMLVEQKFKCALTGIDLIFETHSPWSLSVDCIVPELGYVINNIQFVCWAANRAKGDLNEQDFSTLIEGLYNVSKEHK